MSRFHHRGPTGLPLNPLESGFFLYAEKKKASDRALAACEHCALYVFYEISMASDTRQEEDTLMETTLQLARPAWEPRLHAVLALLRGEPVPQVTARFGLCRSV